MKIKSKYRIVIILCTLIIIILGSAITYSFFSSDSNLSLNQEIAQFIFEAKKTDHIDLSLVNMTPGDTEEYEFSVSNKKSNSISHVTLNYQINIETFHFMPLIIELYKVKNGEQELVLTCDESFARDENNHLICNSPIQEMVYSNEVSDNYKIVVTFPKEYNDVEYSDLVDYISVDIKSWQKTSS